MTDLFDTKDLLTVATADQAVVGTNGYFCDGLQSLAIKIRQSDIGTLTDVIPDAAYCFESNNGASYMFFLPADKVKKPYRALESFEELFDFLMPNFNKDSVYDQTGNKIEVDTNKKAVYLLGKKIVLKDKINKRIRVMVIQSVEYISDSSDNSNVYLNCFSLNELFNAYVIQINDEFVPFGIKEE